MGPAFTLYQNSSSKFLLYKMEVTWEHWEDNFKFVRCLTSTEIYIKKKYKEFTHYFNLTNTMNNQVWFHYSNIKWSWLFSPTFSDIFLQQKLNKT